MSNYVLIAIVAYLLFAVNGVTDKFLLTRAVKHPVVYAFYTGITSPLVFILAPFGLHWVGFATFIVAVIGGASFAVALIYFYFAIQETTISRILPMQGGLVPVFTLLLAYVFLGERLSTQQVFAFLFLVIGAVLVSIKKEKTGWHNRGWNDGVVAAFLFALSFVDIKYVYGNTNFLSGLLWSRLGLFLAAIALLVTSANRRHIFGAPKETSTGSKLLFYGSKLSGAGAGFLQNYAISLGSVSIVNALQGTQFAFLLGMTAFLSKWHPKVLKEQFTQSIVAQKIFAVVLITIGLFLL